MDCVVYILSADDVNKRREGRETQKFSFRPERVLLLGLPLLPPLVDVIGTGKLGSWCGQSLNQKPKKAKQKPKPKQKPKQKLKRNLSSSSTLDASDSIDSIQPATHVDIDLTKHRPPSLTSNYLRFQQMRVYFITLLLIGVS